MNLPPLMTTKLRPRAFYWFLYAVFLIGMLVALDYYFYRVYYKKIAAARQDIPTFFTSDRRIGTNRPVEHASDFRNFSPHKKLGVIRIGCFTVPVCFHS